MKRQYSLTEVSFSCSRSFGNECVSSTSRVPSAAAAGAALTEALTAEVSISPTNIMKLFSDGTAFYFPSGVGEEQKWSEGSVHRASAGGEFQCFPTCDSGGTETFAGTFHSPILC